MEILSLFEVTCPTQLHQCGQSERNSQVCGHQADALRPGHLGSRSRAEAAAGTSGRQTNSYDRRSGILTWRRAAEHRAELQLRQAAPETMDVRNRRRRKLSWRCSRGESAGQEQNTVSGRNRIWVPSLTTWQKYLNQFLRVHEKAGPPGVNKNALGSEKNERAGCQVCVRCDGATRISPPHAPDHILPNRIYTPARSPGVPPKLICA